MWSPGLGDVQKGILSQPQLSSVSDRQVSQLVVGCSNLEENDVGISCSNRLVRAEAVPGDAQLGTTNHVRELARLLLPAEMQHSRCKRQHSGCRHTDELTVFLIP